MTRPPPDPDNPSLKPFWVSFYAQGAWEWHGPWWISGSRDDPKNPNASQDILCAAVLAEDEERAKERIRIAHDKLVQDLEWRFVTEKALDWAPFCERFPRARWMKWPHGPGRTGARP